MKKLKKKLPRKPEVPMGNKGLNNNNNNNNNNT